MWWLKLRDPPSSSPSLSLRPRLQSFSLSGVLRPSRRLCPSLCLHCYRRSSYSFLCSSFRSLRNDSSRISSIHHLGLLKPRLLSSYQPPSPLKPPHSHAIFCCAWRIHLACGSSGSDGCVTQEGAAGGGGSGESLPSLSHRWLLVG